MKACFPTRPQTKAKQSVIHATNNRMNARKLYDPANRNTRLSHKMQRPASDWSNYLIFSCRMPHPVTCCHGDGV